MLVWLRTPLLICHVPLAKDQAELGAFELNVSWKKDRRHCRGRGNAQELTILEPLELKSRAGNGDDGDGSDASSWTESAGTLGGGRKPHGCKLRR